MNSFRRLLNPDVPVEYRNTFLHLAFDIGWYGVLAGSAINFLNVYAARLGATAFQIGLLGAMAALINLLVAIPAAQWIEKRAVGRAVFWSSVFYRVGFLLWVPLPWLFNAQGQIWALIVLALAMGVPLTALGVGFNAFFATIVPPEWRGYVAGIRNVTQAITFMLTSLVCGYLLDHVAFPLNYQIVFLIGAFGAGMSSLHLYFINRGLEKKPLETSHPRRDPTDRIHRNCRAQRIDHRSR